MKNAKELALLAARALSDKKGKEIQVLEIGELTTLADYFVIANGRNIQSVRSLAEDLEDKLTEEGIEPRRKEGERESKWIVLDYAHVIVHIFHPEERKYYNIERLWQDGTNQVQYIPLEAAQKQD